MFRPLPTLAALALVLGAAACQDSGTTPGSTSDLTLDDGFVSMPLGFGAWPGAWAGFPTA